MQIRKADILAKAELNSSPVNSEQCGQPNHYGVRAETEELFMWRILTLMLAEG